MREVEAASSHLPPRQRQDLFDAAMVRIPSCWEEEGGGRTVISFNWPQVCNKRKLERKQITGQILAPAVALNKWILAALGAGCGSALGLGLWRQIFSGSECWRCFVTSREMSLKTHKMHLSSRCTPLESRSLACSECCLWMHVLPSQSSRQ